jgi:hypothetical protein
MPLRTDSRLYYYSLFLAWNALCNAVHVKRGAHHVTSPENRRQSRLGISRSDGCDQIPYLVGQDLDMVMERSARACVGAHPSQPMPPPPPTPSVGSASWDTCR